MFHKRLLKEFRDNRVMIAGMVASQWVMLAANVVLMLWTADYVAGIFYGRAVPERAAGLLLALAAALLVRGAASYAGSRLSFETSRRLKERLRTMIYGKLMRLGSGYRDSMKTSEAVQISTEGVEQLEIYFGKYMPQFFYSMLAPLTLFAVVGTMSLKVAAVLLLCVPLIPVSIVTVQKFAKKMLAKYWGTYTELGDSFLECLQGLTTLKIYQADERYARRMDEESEKFRKVTMRVLIMQLNSISIMDLVAYGGAGVGIILSLLEFGRGSISLNECFFIIMISAEFFLPLRLLGSFFHIAMNGNAAADKIFRLLDEKEPCGGTLQTHTQRCGKECGDTAETIEKPTVSDAQEVSGDPVISLRNVSFSYDGKQTVLRDLTLEAGPGLTALVGKSGCGKSTVTDLVTGRQRAGQGEIRVGGKRITPRDRETLSCRITRIRHDSYLFAGTVRENLLMGKPDAAPKELEEALKKVRLYDFVMANGGLDLELSEKASNLSGGQKQRLALARALLHDSDIYIFDESTSNVDVESENDIMQVVRELAVRKTVLLISHRLANCVDASMIYVLRDGRVAEAGRHEELYQSGGAYHELFESQMQLEQYRKRGTAGGV